MITVCIPTIPPRADLLERALRSVMGQTLMPSNIAIAYDTERLGAAATRNRALFTASTEWVAFLDDDDELYPEHLAKLMAHAEATGADVVFPWFDVEGGGDPFPPDFETREYDPAVPHSFPITTLVRRSFAWAVGGFPPGVHGEVAAGEDWQFWIAVRDRGAKIRHLSERTWRWHHHGANTGGLPDRW